MKFSIIIPVKNNPEQVKRCLATIPAIEDIEILVCDDYSNREIFENIKTICEDFPNTKIIQSTASLGAGHARNMGLDLARGKWVVFCDSDDYFNLDFWCSIETITENSNSDIIYFKVQGVDSVSAENANRGWNYNLLVEGFLSHKKNSEERLRFYHIVPWGKVFRKSFIDKNMIRYDEVRASNDLMFNVKAGNLANKIEAHDSLMYFVTVSDNSLTKKKDREVLRCRFDVLIRHYKYICSIGKPQCAFNMMKFAIKYSRPFGFSEFLFYINKMIKNKINPFIILYKICHYY